MPTEIHHEFPIKSHRTGHLPGVAFLNRGIDRILLISETFDFFGSWEYHTTWLRNVGVPYYLASELVSATPKNSIDNDLIKSILGAFGKGQKSR